MNGVSLITPTGGRPEAFALCERWMAEQTYCGPLQWIVVDDCDPATRATMGQHVIRPFPRWSGSPTLGRNLNLGLDFVQHDAVLVIEDDDWYAPEYIDAMLAELDEHSLVGESRAHYYNVATRRYRIHANTAHASLCQTGFRAELIPAIKDVIARSCGSFIDIRMWESIPGHLTDTRLCVGIKGMPGRRGIGGGHVPGVCAMPDPGLGVLCEWIGADADMYVSYMRDAA